MNKDPREALIGLKEYFTDLGDHAKCASEHKPQAWDMLESIGLAHLICESCPVRADCLDLALRIQTQLGEKNCQGTWGGYSLEDRTQILHVRRGRGKPVITPMQAASVMVETVPEAAGFSVWCEVDDPKHLPCYAIVDGQRGRGGGSVYAIWDATEQAVFFPVDVLNSRLSRALKWDQLDGRPNCNSWKWYTQVETPWGKVPTVRSGHLLAFMYWHTGQTITNTGLNADATYRQMNNQIKRAHQLCNALDAYIKALYGVKAAKPTVKATA